MPVTQDRWINKVLGGTRYVISEKLGEGGMGSVYLAEDRQLGTWVVIKTPHSSMVRDPEFSARFKLEVQSLIALSHPRIVRVLDVGQYGEFPFVVLQYLSGSSLESRLYPSTEPTARPHLLTQVCAWLSEIASALDFIHLQGYIHRDIKPANILFDENQHAYLTDFGIAKVLATVEGSPETKLTATGMILGTAEYMAPELLQGKPVDRRVDQYALAVTVFEALSGTRPYDGNTPAALAFAQVQQPIPQVHQRVPGLPEEVSNVLSRALSLAPKDRFRSCEEFAAALSAAGSTADSPKRFGQTEQSASVTTHQRAAGKQLAKSERRQTTASLSLPNTEAVPLDPLAVLGISDSDLASNTFSEPANSSRLKSPKPRHRTRRTHPRSVGNNLRRSWRMIGVAGLCVLLASVAWVMMRATPESQTTDKSASVPPSDENAKKVSTGQTKPMADSKSTTSPTLQPQPPSPPGTTSDTILEPLTLKGHSNAVSSVAFSPDGKRLASAGYDQTVKVWDATNGELLRTLNGHTSQVWGVAFSSDEKWLASASHDGTVKVWDAKSGELSLTLNGHTGGTACVVFRPDGKRLASASHDGTVKIWDTQSGELSLTLIGHTGVVFSVAFSPDGSRLVSGSHDGTVKVWDASSGEMLQTLNGHTNRVWSVAFSPDGKSLASASEDHSVKLWDATSGKLLRTMNGHRGVVFSVRFSPDGNRFVSASADRTVTLWDATSGELSQVFDRDMGMVLSVAFSPDGKRLASASWDQTVRVWSVAPNSLPNAKPTLPLVSVPSPQPAPLSAPTNKACAVATDLSSLQVPGEHQLIYATANGGLVKLSFNGKPREILKLSSRIPRPLSSIGWKPSTQSFFVVSQSRIFSVTAAFGETAEELCRFPIRAQDATLHPSEDLMAWCRRPSNAPPELIVSKLNGTEETKLGFGFDPIWTADGQKLIFTRVSSSSSSGWGWGIGVREGSKVRDLPIPPVHPAIHLYPTPSPNGQQIVFSMNGADSTMQLGLMSIDGTNTRQLTKTGDGNTRPTFSPDGRYIAFIRGLTSPACVVIIDTQTGEETIVANDAQSIRPVWRTAPPIPESVASGLGTPMGMTDAPASKLKVPLAKSFKNSVGMDFVLVPPESASQESKTDQFYLATTEVTQAQYSQVTGTNPSFHSATGAGKSAIPKGSTSNFPVENIPWIDAATFCNRLSVKEGLVPCYSIQGLAVTFTNNSGYRLPTPGERATVEVQYRDVGKTWEKYSWYRTNSNKQPHRVASRSPDSYELYDVFGNVWEFTSTPGQFTGLMFDSTETDLKPGTAYTNGLDYRSKDLGFRVARNADEAWTTTQTAPKNVAAKKGQATVSTDLSGLGLRTEIYAGTDLDFKSRLLNRVDRQLDWLWIHEPPSPGLPVDNYSVRWTGWLKAPRPGTYKLIVVSDDGVRLWLDDKRLLDDWQGHNPTRYELNVELKARPHKLRVEYFQNNLSALCSLRWSGSLIPEMPIPPEALFQDELVARKTFVPMPTLPPAECGLLAEHFTGTTLQQKTAARDDTQIDNLWGFNTPLQDFSIRWTGWLKPPKPGRYSLRIISDDGARVWIDDRLVIDRWVGQQSTRHATDVDLSDSHTLKVEYFNSAGTCGICSLRWVVPDSTQETVVPATALFRAAPRPVTK